MNIVSHVALSHFAARWDVWSQTPNVLRLSTTLLHFVWQGALAVVIALVLLAVMRRRSQQARYLALLASFALMAAAPIATWFLLPSGRNPVASLESVIRDRQDALIHVGETSSPLTTVEFDGVLDPINPVNASAASAGFDKPQNSPVASQRGPSRFDAANSAASEWLRLYRPWIATAWLVGVTLLGLRLVLGLAGAEVTRRRGRVAAPQAVERAVAELAGCLGIGRSVAVFESTLTAVPTLVGWLSPVILLPASAISGLTTDQLEAILAHELAHVRRHDYLVNLLQTVVETLLFYHPAVWWLSRKIRQERELCCDDIAVELCGDRLAYARALATLEEQRTAQPSWVMAASGGVLANRIRRVVGRPQPVGADRLSLFTVLAAMLLVICAVGRTGGLLDAAYQPAAISSHEPPLSTAKIILAGQVVDDFGKPVSDARVCWVRDTMDAKGRIKRHPIDGKTDARGRFRFERPATETSVQSALNRDVVWVLAPKMGLTYESARLALEAKVNGPEWQIRLRPAKDLSLVVNDPDGQPLVEAVVTPWNIEYDLVPDSLREHLWRTTDEHGQVVLPAMATGHLQIIRVESDQYGTELVQGYRDGFVTKNKITMSPVERVLGQVLAADPKSFQGLEAVVERYHPTLAIARAKVDEHGRFEIQSFPRGANQVSLRRGSETIRTLDPILQYDREQHIKKFTIPLEEPVLVRGAVQTEDTHAPVPGAEVAVVYGKTSMAEHVVSDPHGKFAARVIPGPVTVSIVVIPPPFRGKYLQSAQAADRTEVPFGAEGFQLPAVYLARAKAVRGKLVDTHGQPIAGAMISGEVNTRRYGFGKTNAKGEFSGLVPSSSSIDDYAVWLPGKSSRRPRSASVQELDPLVLALADLPEPNAAVAKASAAAPKAEKALPDAGSLTYDFHIVTTRGKPIVGAVVRPWAVSAGGGGFLITDATAGAVKSDSAGTARALLKIEGKSPEALKMQTALKEGIRAVAITVDHPDHPVWSGYVPVDGKRRVVLSDSITIEIRGHRAGDKAPLSRLFPVLSRSVMDGGDWSEQNGVLTIRRVDLDGEKPWRWLRIVHVPEGGPVLYSDLVDLKLRVEKHISLDLPLKPSVRLEGKLAAKVPRPVKHGRVVGQIVDGHEAWSNWWWCATAEITPDGRFVLDSLPDDENLQLVALCDGWHSASPTLEEATRYAKTNRFSDLVYHGPRANTVFPRLVRLQGSTVRTTVPMLRTATCQVSVLDEGGRPLAGASVEFLPSVTIYDQASFVFGTGVDCLDVVRRQLGSGQHRTAPASHRLMTRLKSYSAKTNAQGLATVTDIALGGATENSKPTPAPFEVSLDSYSESPTMSVGLMPGQVGQSVVRLKKR